MLKKMQYRFAVYFGTLSISFINVIVANTGRKKGYCIQGELLGDPEVTANIY